MADEKKSLLDFQDPGTLDEELTYVPGFINELTRYTLEGAHSPNRTLAFLGATTMLAHLAGRSYADTHGTRTNLYVMALGETGIGKDAPRRTNRKLADAIGITPRLCDQVASGEALEELIAKHPALLFQPDEVENFIGALRGTGKCANSLSERVRRLYTASAGLYAVRSTARMPEGDLVAYPHLSLFGTGTPTAFYNALDANAVTNGLFGRCLVLRVPDEYRVNNPIETPIPSDIIAFARMLANRENVINHANALDLITVSETDAARALLEESGRKIMTLRQDFANRELLTARALVVRMNEKIAKLAMIYAISAQPETPIITADGVVWATKLVMHITKAMLYEAQFHIAEGKFDALVKRTTAFMCKHGGVADHSSLIHHLRIDAHTLKKVMGTLMMAGDVEAESLSRGKVLYSLCSLQQSE